VIGWNRGTNRLSFVLVADVAAAMLGVLRAEGIEGRCFNLVGGMHPMRGTDAACALRAGLS
jgi:nucleoside-diphosphate-sugar epimerase